MYTSRIIALVSIFISGIFSICGAQSAATTPKVTPEEMGRWWNDLQLSEPESTRALLNFSDHPAETVAFFKDHLKPLKIDQTDLDGLLEMLNSDDEKIWKPAFEKLLYFDPRLNVDLQKLIDDNQDPLGRNRLIEVLCDYPPGTLRGKEVSLRASGGTGDFNFFSDRGSWWAESKISRLDSAFGWNHKRGWVRADRAIVLLQHIGTPDAVAILKDMATGHPDAHPTQIAKAALVR